MKILLVIIITMSGCTSRPIRKKKKFNPMNADFYRQECRHEAKVYGKIGPYAKRLYIDECMTKKGYDVR